MQSVALYLHIPFCRVVCSYCDFNVYAGLGRLIAPYARALAREIHLIGAERGLQARTIFFGGGTPSLMPLPSLANVLAACREAFDVAPDVEITLEANPDGLDATQVAGWRALGINRLSFGVQSAHEDELRLFRRTHTFADVVQAVRLARAAGFDNVALDLIYGIPYQTLASWRETLVRATDLGPDHLSLYSLTVEEGTPLHIWVAKGKVPEPDPDLMADMYEFAQDFLAEAGYQHYEISNWARNGLMSRHNLIYWRNQPYLGFGAGAHGSYGGWRYWNVLTPQDYIARLEPAEAAPDFPFSPALAGCERISRELEMGETMMLGLRLIQEGVAFADFQYRFGADMRLIYAKELEQFQKYRLIEVNAERVRLTQRGRVLGNEVFAAFLP